MLCLYSLITGITFTKLTFFSSINNVFIKKDKSITYRLGLTENLIQTLDEISNDLQAIDQVQRKIKKTPFCNAKECLFYLQIKRF